MLNECANCTVKWCNKGLYVCVCVCVQVRRSSENSVFILTKSEICGWSPKCLTKFTFKLSWDRY